MTRRLEVDIRACDAYGYCAELLPEVVTRDEWGYPIVAGDLTDELLDDARRAVAACPRLALTLTANAQRPPTAPEGVRDSMTAA